MQLVSTYSIKIKNYKNVLKETVTAYRHAVTCFIGVAFGRMGYDSNDMTLESKGIFKLNCVNCL